MDKELLKKQIYKSIDEKYAVSFLASLVRLPSQNFEPTYAQELVISQLGKMKFDVDVFPCETESIAGLPDFCGFPGII